MENYDKDRQKEGVNLDQQLDVSPVVLSLPLLNNADR